MKREEKMNEKMKKKGNRKHLKANISTSPLWSFKSDCFAPSHPPRIVFFREDAAWPHGCSLFTFAFLFLFISKSILDKKKPEANSSARKLIINHKQDYSLYPNLNCELKKWPLVFYLFDIEMNRNIKAFIINLFTFINGLLNEFFNVKYWQIDKHMDRSYRM